MLERALSGNGGSVWLEEELDYLWIGVRRHGRERWDAILRDRRLRFSPWRVAKDLATQWEEEQCKLLNGNYFPFNTGIRRENFMEEIQLSLGDVYAQKEGKFNMTNTHDNFQRPLRNTRTVYQTLYGLIALQLVWVLPIIICLIGSKKLLVSPKRG